MQASKKQVMFEGMCDLVDDPDALQEMAENFDPTI